MKRSSKVILCIIAIAVGVTLGASSLFTPPPRKVGEGFSAESAAGFIQEFARAPHTAVADQAELARVRDYLSAKLAAFGCTVTAKTYPGVRDEDGVSYDVTNILGVLPPSAGASGESPSLLLVAHYDSNPGLGIGETPGSTGAGDDGYGIAVILETLRILQSDVSREGTIKVLFTDAEEVDMLGAKAAAQDPSLGILSSAAVLNIESRGLHGPAVMFETSKNNAAIIGFYARHSPLPAAWSLAPEVYRIMPNYTDFTAFTNAGMDGLNFSVLDSLEENHTALDNTARIDLASIQAYGDQILPVVQGFADYPVADFRTNTDMTYFTILPGVMVSYPSVINYVFLGASLLAVAWYFVAGLRNKSIRARRLWGILMVLGFALFAAGAGYGISYGLSKAFKLPFSLTNMPGVPVYGLIAGAAAVLVGIVFFFVSRALLRRSWRYEELFVCVLALLFIFQAALTFALPGGAFLFGWAVLPGALLGLVAMKLPSVFRPLSALPALWVFVPVVVLLLISLSIGALAVVLLFAAFPLLLAVPSLAEASHRRSR